MSSGIVKESGSSCFICGGIHWLAAVRLTAVPAYPAIRSTMSTRLVLAEELQRASVCLRAQFVLAEDLPRHLDDGGFALGHGRQRALVTDDVDDLAIHTDRVRFHFMQRPLVWLIVLARRGDDGQLGELPAKRRVPSGAEARSVKPQQGGSLRTIGAGCIVGALVGVVQLFPLDWRQTAARDRIDVLRQRSVGCGACRGPLGGQDGVRPGRRRRDEDAPT